MPHDPKLLADIVRSASAGLAYEIAFKPMFGGILGFVNGKAWISLSDVGLAVKLPPNEQERLLALPGAERLRYEPSQPPSKQYIVLPEAMHDDKATLGEWLETSANFVASQPDKKKK